MGSDKICAKKQVSDSGPQNFEGGLPSNVFPSDAMYGGEEEGRSRRADQVIFPRHTHVSQLIAAWMDVLTISRRIGHASPEITLRVYGHLFTNTDARVAEIMEATFAKVRTE
jgi:hypothetical protein